MELNFTKHKGLFITATDTGVGKTLISGAIAKILTDAGENIGVFKPIVSGSVSTREGLVGEDTIFLAQSANSKFPLDVITPENFITPAAPLACQAAENRPVNMEKIITAYNYICSQTDAVIVEGIGGVKVPITETLDVLGLAKLLALPVVIVARPDLGTINHTLLTIEAVRNAKLPLAGVVISGYDEPSADYAVKTAPQIISDCGQVEILAVVPFDHQTDIANGIIGDVVLDSLSGIDWLKVMKENE